MACLVPGPSSTVVTLLYCVLEASLMRERIVSARPQEGEIRSEADLRPRTLAEYIGQEKVVEALRILVEAARQRGEPLDHILLYGPPGLGKTTLAHVLANEMRSAIRVTSGPAIERAGDLAAILTNLRPGDILFVDEIHRLAKPVEEILYPAMEEFALDIIVGRGPGARSIRLSLPRFTVIGATTRLALLSSPLRSRFGAVHRLDFYDEQAMRQVVRRAALILGVSIDEEGIAEIARRSRGTPRVANRLLRRVRDYATVRAGGHIDKVVAQEALAVLGIDECGLDELDRKVLRALVEKFGGGPVGLETVAASVSEEPDTIMDVCEPYLLQCGLIERTPRGRVATRLAYERLGLTPPAPSQPSLF